MLKMHFIFISLFINFNSLDYVMIYLIIEYLII